VSGYVIPPQELYHVAAVVDAGRKWLKRNGVTIPPALASRLDDLAAVAELIESNHASANGNRGNGSEQANGNAAGDRVEHDQTMVLDMVSCLLSADATAKARRELTRSTRRHAELLGGRRRNGTWQIPADRVEAERSRRDG
jgi:hypothetical protein